MCVCVVIVIGCRIIIVLNVSRFNTLLYILLCHCILIKAHTCRPFVVDLITSLHCILFHRVTYVYPSPFTLHYQTPPLPVVITPTYTFHHTLFVHICYCAILLLLLLILVRYIVVGTYCIVVALLCWTLFIVPMFVVVGSAVGCLGCYCCC